jgi:hypothetical protein
MCGSSQVAKYRQSLFGGSEKRDSTWRHNGFRIVSFSVEPSKFHALSVLCTRSLPASPCRRQVHFTPKKQRRPGEERRSSSGKNPHKLEPQPFTEKELRHLLSQVPKTFTFPAKAALIHCMVATGLAIRDTVQLERALRPFSITLPISDNVVSFHFSYHSRIQTRQDSCTENWQVLPLPPRINPTWLREQERLNAIE